MTSAAGWKTPSLALRATNRYRRQRTGDFSRGDPARYAADATAVVEAESVRFPVAVAVRQPTYEAAVWAVRQTLDGLRQQLAGLNLGPAELEAHQLRCLPEPKGAARVELTATLVLRWAANTGGF